MVEVPFFAGRIVKHDVARDRIQIENSTDDGVRFKFNDLTLSETQPSFDDLEQAHFPPSKLDISLLPMNVLFTTGSNYPALLLQANFIKGGLLLAVCPHHSTTDAVGWTVLIKSWAKYTAAAAKGSRITPRQTPEMLDRSPLLGMKKNIDLEDTKHLVKTGNVAKPLNKHPDSSRETISGALAHTRNSNFLSYSILTWYPGEVRTNQCMANIVGKGSRMGMSTRSSLSIHSVRKKEKTSISDVNEYNLSKRHER